VTDTDPRMAAASVEAIRAMHPVVLNRLIADAPNTADARPRLAARLIAGEGA
jgi:hypothetical protein